MASTRKAEIKIAKTKTEIAEAMQIRRQVFIEGQGVAEDIDQDGKDDESKHVLLKIDGKPIATARLRPLGHGKMKIERMAVIESYRSQGVGKKVLAFIEEYAKEQGVKELVLHSHWNARGFYLKAGYEETGEPFEEAGTPHITMHKVIS
jgi:predicted GNAT family N-acyltransferase